MALEAGLGEILAEGLSARIEAHARAAAALRTAWSVLGLRSVPRSDVIGNTLSVLLFPELLGPKIAAPASRAAATAADGRTTPPTPPRDPAVAAPREGRRRRRGEEAAGALRGALDPRPSRSRNEPSRHPIPRGPRRFRPTPASLAQCPDPLLSQPPPLPAGRVLHAASRHPRQSK